MTDLEPINPSEAVQMYLDDIDGTLSPNSVDAYRYKLDFFLDWATGEEDSEPRLTDMTELTGRARSRRSV